MSMRYSLEIAHDPKTGRASEDAHLVVTGEDSVLLAVMDGAGQRVKTTGSLRPLLNRYGPDTSAGRYAAYYTRDRLRQLFAEDPTRDLTATVLAINAELGADLAHLYGGELTAQAVLALEPNLHILAEDQRHVRFILPVCCFTVVRVNFVQQQFEVTHGGDTALFIFYEDGTVSRVTPDQMQQHDYRAFKAAQRGFHEKGESPGSIADHPEAADVNLRNGIYHNYENPDGMPDKSVGVGVINGLPHLEHYIHGGVYSLIGVVGLMVASDGIYWSVPLDEAGYTLDERLLFMREKIEAAGLHSYIAQKRAHDMQTFAASQYPVIGRNDDITGIYLRLYP